jgi:hypothetical protein
LCFKLDFSNSYNYLLPGQKYIILFLVLVFIIALLVKGPIPQDQNYHDFADQRKLLGIPHFFDVITNLPFAIVGFLGLLAVRNGQEKELKLITSTLFSGFLLLTIGSSYYHLNPNNNTLVYDRIPMVIIFMSFFAFIIHDQIGRRKGFNAFIILNIIGISSVIYWAVSESIGHGDLRWYGMVQFFPILAIPLILVLYKSTLVPWKEIILIFIFFGLAKLTEKFDKEIYNYLLSIISGHSLKHLLMAVAEYEIVVMMRYRIKAG